MGLDADGREQWRQFQDGGDNLEAAGGVRAAKDGLPPVNKEYYVMQGDFYTAGKFGERWMNLLKAYGVPFEKIAPAFAEFHGADRRYQIKLAALKEQEALQANNPDTLSAIALGV